MRFSANDWLVHPQHGVGRVVRLETRQFGPGTRQEYYEIAITTGTVWVPVEAPPSGLRKLTPKGDLGRYRGVLRSRPTPLVADLKQRRIILFERLKESSFQSRCELVRDLTAHSRCKPLNESSDKLLRSARLLLCAEWAAAEGLSVGEATCEVDSLLLEGTETYGK
jgi:CarD family transcriptional regulator